MNSTHLAPTDIFVFGSNLAGRHGKGAALTAYKYHGAEYGIGQGRTGKAYAIPTKGFYLETLPLHVIKYHIDLFKEYAKDFSNESFYITRVGCGLAGYKDYQIAPLFKNAPSNCKLPNNWID